MTPYRTNDTSFCLPGQWTDQTTVLLSQPAPDGSNFSFVIERNELEPDASFEGFVEDKSEQLAQTLRGYELIAERDVTIEGWWAHESKFVWRHPQGQLFHLVLHVAFGSLVMTFTASCRSPFADDCERIMDAVVESVRFAA